MASPAENIATIEETLARLYAKDKAKMAVEERETVFQDISKLERSLEFWEGRLAKSKGKTKARITGITYGKS